MYKADKSGFLVTVSLYFKFGLQTEKDNNGKGTALFVRHDKTYFSVADGTSGQSNLSGSR